jgi:hypothetical protein
MQRQAILLLAVASLLSIAAVPVNAQGLGSGSTPSYGGGFGLQSGGGGGSGFGSYGQPIYAPGGSWTGPGGGYSGYGGGNYSGRPLGSFGNIGNPYGNGYYNNPYYGTYGPIGAPIGTQVYGAPVAVPGISGFYRFGRVGINYWQSPSGYYYPWGAGAVGGAVQQNIYYKESSNSTTTAKPPIPTMLGDMEKYLDDSKTKGRISDADYQHIFRRVQDLRSKYSRLAAEWDGVLDPTDESRLRGDVEQVSSEIALRVRPIAPGSGSNSSSSSK